MQLIIINTDDSIVICKSERTNMHVTIYVKKTTLPVVI